MEVNRPFLGLLTIVDELIKKGYLQQDPNNKNNIIVYRNGGTITEDGWYSENIHTAMNETYHDKDQLISFLETAKECGVDVEKHFADAKDLLHMDYEEMEK